MGRSCHPHVLRPLGKERRSKQAQGRNGDWNKKRKREPRGGGRAEPLRRSRYAAVRQVHRCEPDRRPDQILLPDRAKQREAQKAPSPIIMVKNLTQSGRPQKHQGIFMYLSKMLL